MVSLYFFYSQAYSSNQDLDYLKTYVPSWNFSVRLPHIMSKYFRRFLLKKVSSWVFKEMRNIDGIDRLGKLHVNGMYWKWQKEERRLGERREQTCHTAQTRAAHTPDLTVSLTLEWVSDCPVYNPVVHLFGCSCDSTLYHVGMSCINTDCIIIKS